MNKSNRRWRGFMGHLGPYITVIGMLAIINLVTSPQYWWFLWPALGWGVGLAFHFFGTVISSLNISRKWRGFVGHFGSYAIIIGMLGIINLATSSDYLWFLWPALGWGVAIALHFWGTLIGQESSKKSAVAATVARSMDQDAVKETQSEPDEIKSRPLLHSVSKHTIFSNQAIQNRLDQAHAYKTQIESFIQATANENSRARLQELAAQVDEWIEAIEDLAHRVDDFQQNTLIHQDLESVPRSIEDLEKRLATEPDPVTRTELEKVLANRKNQLASLERLQSTMNRAELQIENTLSSLGTIYSQLLTGQSTDHVADYHRLSTDVDEEVRKLQDHLEALEEVKLGRG